MPELIQIWWHVEPIFNPVIGHKFKQVMDIFIQDDNNNFNLSNKLSFSIPKEVHGIRIFCRNLNYGELAFIADENNQNNPKYFNINVTLPELDQFPIVENDRENNVVTRHVKIELQYTTLQNTPIKYKTNIFKPRIIGMFELDFPSNIVFYPEFNFKFPKGWEFDKFKSGDYVAKAFAISDNTSSLKPIISPEVDDEIHKYSILIPFDNLNEKLIFTYSAKLTLPMSIILWTPLLLVLIGFAICLFSFFIDVIPIALTFTVVSLAYLYAYMQCQREGYHIHPNYIKRNGIMAKILISIIIIMISIGIYKSITFTDIAELNIFMNIFM